jgi:PHD/YefM family antitoxin component YafN of YafNO toxin-antitoxin module
MDRLLQMDKGKYLAEMRAEVERLLGKVADAVNAAPDGNVINASEWEVHHLMEELRRVAYQKAVQMRIDSTEGSFSPSQGLGGLAQAEQGAVIAKRKHR